MTDNEQPPPVLGDEQRGALVDELSQLTTALNDGQPADCLGCFGSDGELVDRVYQARQDYAAMGDDR